ncbi:MAG: entericidin A/B family lipoprotein [Macromonas bipunctata]|jgi:predicted small secreted protein|nr:entericidin A/B family lipoprotein [Macromonas bipunctata]
MRLFTALITLSALLMLGGCNTVRGIGQDIEKAGSTIEKVAQ